MLVRCVHCDAELVAPVRSEYWSGPALCWWLNHVPRNTSGSFATLAAIRFTLRLQQLLKAAATKKNPKQNTHLGLVVVCCLT